MKKKRTPCEEEENSIFVEDKIELLQVCMKKRGLVCLQDEEDVKKS